MASIQTGIELQDNFSSVMYGIISVANMGVSAMDDMQSAMNTDIDTSSIADARDEIEQTTAAVEEMNAALQSQMNQSVVNTDAIPTMSNQNDVNQQPAITPIQPNAPPEPVTVPVQWESDGLEVFSTTGYERFQQEVQSANGMLNTLNQTQASIEQTASGLDILPDAAIQDINSLGQRLQMVQQRMQQIENNPVNMNSDTANAELEQLRGQLQSLIGQQNELNAAMERADVSDINAAYLNLSQNISNTERYIRDNTDEQGRFNQEIQDGVGQADSLMNTIKGAVAAYASIQTIGNVIELSDEMTQTTARLDLIVDDGGSVEELQNKIYASAQAARGDYQQTADAISKLGMQASQAFSSNDELIGFTELLNKQFVNAGTSAQGVESVMLQLTQSMAAGKLQGEELNAVLDNAAPIVQNIQKYLEEVQGVDASNIKQLASDGVITADIIKQSMFYAADEINAKFETMPMTWGDVWQSFKNTAFIAFQPVLQRINDLANSEALNTLISNTVAALVIIAGAILDVFDMVGSVGSFIADNWSIISPIIYGVIAALAAYVVISAIVATVNGIIAASQAVHAAAAMMAAGATFAQTAAQYGLNAALAACPITWIILLIIALIAIIFAVCSAIAKMTGIANSGFGVITGGVNVVIQFFKNLGLTVANIALGIGNAIAALGSNMMTAFHNAICSIQSWFYDLLSTGLSVIEGICAALNKLPFVEFDYSGITSAADDYAAKSAEAAANKEEYQSISDAFSEGMSTFDTFQDGWISNAFDAGAALGDGVADKISNFSLADLIGGAEMPNPSDYQTDYSQFAGMGDNLDSISGDTSNISDSLDATQEEIKYLRDIAEQEAVNRFTTAEITIEQTNNNNVSGGMDLDGVVSGLTDAVNEAVDIITEGVHD